MSTANLSFTIFVIVFIVAVLGLGVSLIGSLIRSGILDSLDKEKKS